VRILVIGRGHVRGGLAGLWQAAGVAVPGDAIGEALSNVAGLAGTTTTTRPTPSPAQTTVSIRSRREVESIIGGPDCKSFKTNFANIHGQVAAPPEPPINAYAAHPDASAATARSN
jgi:hypothetical protein